MRIIIVGIEVFVYDIFERVREKGDKGIMKC